MRYSAILSAQHMQKIQMSPPWKKQTAWARCNYTAGLCNLITRSTTILGYWKGSLKLKTNYVLMTKPGECNNQDSLMYRLHIKFSWLSINDADLKLELSFAFFFRIWTSGWDINNRRGCCLPILISTRLMFNLSFS